MSHPADTWDRRPDQQPGLRRLLTVVLVLLAVLGVVVGGTLIRPQAAAAPPPRVALVGRTSAICTVAAAAPDQPQPQPSDSPSPAQPSDPASPAQPSPDQPVQAPQGTTSVTGVAIRQAPGRPGTLQGHALDSDQPQLSVTEQGKAAQVAAAKASVVLDGDGGMASSSTGAVFGVAQSGIDTGLSAAPCLPPGTQHWFTGFVAGDADRTELILTNPDDAQAEVDLRFFGKQGRVVVPGSPAVLVEAHSSRTVSLSTLVSTDGPFSVEVQASQGRVSAVARRTRTAALKPSGADWQVPSTSPALTSVIPGLPEGEGSRQLLVTNPGTARATVQVAVLGLQGPYAPVGAASVQVPPESTASLDLTAGLATESGAVKLVSDLPVTGAVISASKRTASAPDFAVQSAASPLVHDGVSAVATTPGTATEMILSNGSDTDTPVTFEVLSYDGVVLRTDEVLVAAESTATRRITSPAPSYLVVKVPSGSAVVGGMVITQPEGDVAGLATVPLLSPDVASRAPGTVLDPAVGR